MSFSKMFVDVSADMSDSGTNSLPSSSSSQRETFVAQGLFGIDHNINFGLQAEIINFAKDFKDGILGESGLWRQVVGTLCKLITVYRTDDRVIMGLTLVDMFVNWGVDVGIAQTAWTMLTPYVEQLFTYSSSFIAQSGTIVPEAILKAICAILTCVFAIIGSMALPSQKLIDGVLKRVNDLGRASTGFTTLFDAASGMFERIYGYVYEFLYGVPLPGKELDEFLAGIRDWYVRVSDISNLETTDAIPVDFKVCRTIEKLYAEGKDYVKRLEGFKLTPAQKQPFDQYWRIVCKVYDRVIGHGARTHAPRTEPLIMQLFGASSVGKSGLTYLLAQDLLAIEGLENDVMNEVYFRNVEQEYWDGYNNQAICVYDDFGQMRDSTGNPNKEFMEIIRTGNIAPWPLHMAGIEEKARTRFNSRCCILTSNQKKFEMGSLTHDTAFMRRLDIYAEVSVNPAYALPNGRIDPNKCKSCLDSDVYMFTLYGEDSKPKQRNSRSYQLENITLNYEEFVSLAASIYKKKYFESKGKIEFLQNRANSLTKPRVINFTDDQLAFSSKETEKFVAQVLPASWFSNFTTGVKLDKGCSIRLWEIVCQCIWMDVRNGRADKFVYGESYADLLPYLRDIACTSENSTDYLRDAYTYIAVESAYLLDTEFVVEEKIYEQMNDLFYGKMSLSKRVVKVAKDYALYCYDKFVKSIKDLSKIVIPAMAQGLKTFINVISSCVAFWLTIKACGFVRRSIMGPQWPFTSESQEDESEENLSESVQPDKIKSRPAEKHYKESVQADKIKSKPTAKHYIESVDTDRKPNAKGKVFKNEFFTDSRSSRRATEKLSTEAAIDTNAQEVLNTTVKSNVYFLYSENNGVWKPTVNVVFIRGRVAITVAHAVPSLSENLKLANAWVSEGYTLRLSDCKINKFYSSNGENKDLISITFPNTIPSHPNMVKHFATLGDYAAFKQCRGNLYSLHSSVKKEKEHTTERVYTVLNLRAVEGISYVDTSCGQEEQVNLRHGYIYESETKAGDCGGLLMLSNPSLPRKIIGVHVAGANSGKALALAISQEMLKSHMDEVCDFQSQVSFNFEDIPMDPYAMPMLPEGDFIPYGKANASAGSSSKTQLRASKLHGLIAQPKTKPAFLRPIKIEGEWVDPMMKGLKKCGIQNPLLNDSILATCKNHVVQKLRKFTYADKRILTHAEAIQGVEGDEWLLPMNRRSSPGYPWNLKRDGKMGKTKWLGSDEDYILDNADLLEICTRRINMAKEGMRLPTLWTDTLKDERRPIAKVDEGKTRVFSAGSMDFILNVRQYFLTFNAAMMHHRIENEIALGINPFSEDWHYLALHLQKKGDQVCAGDFSNFDGSLLSSMLWTVCDIINEWYGDSEENQRIRYVLFADIINSIHINGNNIYGWTHSQPSGNPLTTIINCLMNCLIFRYVFITSTGMGMREWDQHISFISYGDDNVINIDKSIINIFNQEIISEHCTKIGFTYTDEAKTGVLVKYKSLKDINFLKRSFLRDADSGLYEAPLELDVILEMGMWIRGTTDIDSSCANNIEVAYRELSLHGRPTFNKWANYINDLCLEHLHEPPTLYTYDEYKSMVMNYF